MPDSVSDLCTKCLQLVDEDGSNPVTTEVVEKAAKLLRLASMMQALDAETESPDHNDIEGVGRGRLTALMNGVVVDEQTLHRGHLLIGRDDVCSIHLDSSTVSRHHALIVISSNGVRLLDLGSTNGTYVNGRRVEQHALQDDDVISVGDCKLEYFAGDETQAWGADTEATDQFEPNISDLAPGRKARGQHAGSRG